MIRTIAIATLVCLASWAGLAFGAGNVGLQRTILIGPWTLFEQPLAVVLPTAIAFAITFAMTGAVRATAAGSWRLITAVLLGDAFGAIVLAPILVGELEIRDAPVVFVVITILGLQPLAVAVAWLARQRATR